MTLKLDDYRELLEQADPHVRDVLEAHFAEAARVMSPHGLQDWLEGARALCSIGRGKALVIHYVEATPAVAKEVGEDAVTEAVTHAMKLASMVSGEVIALLFASLPVAARRLGDLELFKQYLALVHQLSAEAPRGLRPMLGRLDELLASSRWAVCVAGRCGARRRTAVILRPKAGDVETREGYRPYIESRVIHLPDAYDDVQGCANAASAGRARAADVQGCANAASAGHAGAADWQGLPGKDLYRAAATHAAAHLAYTRKPLSAEALSPAQTFLIGLMEDARVEALAIRQFPGLKSLWLGFHEALAGGEGGRDPRVQALEPRRR